METRKNIACKGDKGFTLVELAIVMIIIGLLIGGVLKGQELITNAQVTSTVAQVKGVDAAISTFRDAYNSVPGDMTPQATVQVRIPVCTAAPCNRAGDGNGVIGTTTGTAPGTVPAAASEELTAWSQLNAAGVLSGVDGSATLAFGQGLPAANVGGGMFINQSTTGANGVANLGGNLRAGVYISLVGSPNASASATNGVLTPSVAARIDRKLDDGVPTTGGVQAGGATACITGTLWNEAANTSQCLLYARIQG